MAEPLLRRIRPATTDVITTDEQATAPTDDELMAGLIAGRIASLERATPASTRRAAAKKPAAAPRKKAAPSKKAAPRKSAS